MEAMICARSGGMFADSFSEAAGHHHGDVVEPEFGLL
jgi:hypothetical protein